MLSAFSCPPLTQKGKNKDSEILPFGEVTKQELEFKDCDFDKDAEAMVLFEDGELSLVYNVGLVLEKHVRIKILKTEGLDWSDIHLRYPSYKNDGLIKDIVANTFNLNSSGNITGKLRLEQHKIPAAGYAEVKSFFDNLAKDESQKIVIKKQ